MTEQPLFTLPTAPPGAIRAALDRRLATQPELGDSHPDLILLARSLAGRLDRMDAGGDRRGYVMLAAEYRAARRDLLGDGAAAGPDPLDEALAAFRAAQEGNTPGPVPQH